MSEENNEEQPKELDFDGTPMHQKVERQPITIKKKLVYAGLFSVIVIMGFVYIMAQLIVENSQCTSNPFSYAANTIQTSEGSNIEPLCACQVGQAGFWFDKEGTYDKSPLTRIDTGTPGISGNVKKSWLK